MAGRLELSGGVWVSLARWVFCGEWGVPSRQGGGWRTSLLLAGHGTMLRSSRSYHPTHQGPHPALAPFLN